MNEEKPSSITSEFYAGLYFSEKNNFPVGKQRRIVVDLSREEVLFENCHTQRKFLAMREAEFVCPLTDIRDVYEYSELGKRNKLRGYLTVVTTDGKVVIPAYASNYQELRDFLTPLADLTPAGPAEDGIQSGGDPNIEPVPVESY